MARNVQEEFNIDDWIWMVTSQDFQHWMSLHFLKINFGWGINSSVTKGNQARMIGYSFKHEKFFVIKLTASPYKQYLCEHATNSCHSSHT